MSAAEILSELPRLSPDEIDLIFFRAADLRQHEINPSPQLLARIGEADKSFAENGGMPIDDFESIVKTWPTK